MRKLLVCWGVVVSVSLLPLSNLSDVPARQGGTPAADAHPHHTVRIQAIRDLWAARSPAERWSGPSAGVATNGAHTAGADEWAGLGHVLTAEQVPDVPADTLHMIEATKAWREAGVKGEGTLIAIIDTGINPQHPDFPAPRDKHAARQKSGSAQKVIPGYNWADRNQVTEDVGEAQHGTHVAGIAAANGKVKGVAPEAQLLSQKVFSNYQGDVSGLGESILFAINDSIAKKADVINLSLGSSAGYVDETNMEQYAIRRAVDHGVVVVAAAGNDGYFGSDKVKAQNPDISMIGSPGLAPDAFSVASVNATTLAGVSFAVSGVDGLSRVVYLVGRPLAGEANNPLTSLAQPYELVYVGKGKKEDYIVSVKGKIVLIERGDIPFDEKLRLAKEAGAAGAIVYNNQPGPVVMTAEETKHLPAVSILREAGERMAAQLKRGKQVTVTFDGQYAQNRLPYPSGGTLSVFSSWGPTPDLQFKPEITAPGGGVLSTVLRSDYAVKSGTSMATPHVAGAMALMKQAYRKQGRNLQGRQLVETLKAAAMNTAEPILDPRAAELAEGKDGPYPYSPRVQGAGLLQVAKALKTPVIVTDRKGKAGVSLGQIGLSTTFSLYLDNKFGDKPLTYEVKNPYGVLTDLHKDGYNWLTEVPLTGATLSFSASRVTVAPGKRQEVKVTLTLPRDTPRNIFADGFVAFVPTEEGVPTLRVPFYGFYGDWNEPRVMDAPLWDPASQEKRTGVKTTWHHDKENDKHRYRDYLGVTGMDESGDVRIDPQQIAFSPNGDGHYDVASPSVTFLRNAREVQIDVTDRSGNLVRALVRDEKISKFDQSRLGIPYFYTEKEEWAWDGKAYSPEKGTYVTAPDGAYQFIIRAKIDGRQSDWQTLTLPVRIDTRPPSVHASMSGSRIVWSTRDKDIQGYLLYADGKKAGGPYAAGQNSVAVSQTRRTFTLVAYDYAGNLTVVPVNGQGDTTPPEVHFPDDLFQQVLVTNRPHVAIRGRIAGEDLLDRVRLVIHKTPVPVELDGSFETVLTLPEGLSYVTYSATDAYGNNRQFTQRVIVDTTPPQLTLANDGTEESYVDASTRQMLLPLRVQVRDLTYKGKLKVNGQIIASWEEQQLELPVEKHLVHQVPLRHGENRLLVEGEDEAGNRATLAIQAYADAQSGTLVMHHGEQRLQYTAKPLPAPSVGFVQRSFEKRSGEPLYIEGRVTSHAPVRLLVYYGANRLEPDVNDRGTFRLALPAVQEGREKVTVVVVDALGREARAQAVVVGRKR